ncbi:MAG: right-handed parallel beta-helix repeat-containing protein [Rhodopseudomonas palustris]|nr:right-handed parallel beta-helix repeat-containing protein [Rhodopseudomonas palustris]
MASGLPGGIRNNLISGNYGNGVYMTDSNVGPISGNIIDASFRMPGDAPGAGIFGESSIATVENNWIRSNEGPGISLTEGGGKIAGNVIEDNGIDGVAGGIYIDGIQGNTCCH